MNLYPVYHTPAPPLPRWQTELLAVPVCLIGVLVLIAWECAVKPLWRLK